MSEKPINIYQRINAVMRKVKYVQKDRQVTGGGANYKAVTHDQVISVAREALVEYGVVVFPEQVASEILIQRDLEKQIKMHLYSGEYKINFVNIDNPDDKITVSINAHANDNGDKAPGKAVTYATKTAILKVLCLETGENDESREESKVGYITPDQQNELAGLIKGDDALWQNLCAAYSIQGLEFIKVTKLEEIKQRIETYWSRRNASN